MEYGVAATIISLLAILKALTAKYSLSTVPWFEVIIKPNYFNEADEIVRGLLYLLSWVLASIGISLLITFSLKNSSDLAKYVYDYIGYDNPSAGTAGLITTVVFNIALYMFLVNKTKYVTIKSTRKIPAKISGIKPNAEEFPKSVKELVATLFKNLFYLTPSLLSHIYSYFYLEAGHLITGSARLLLNDYGKETILSFFDDHILKNGDSEISDLSENLINKNFSDFDRGFELLVTKIKLKGYYSTRKYLRSYIENRNKNRIDKEMRFESRVILENPPQIAFQNSGISNTAFIQEYSKNFSGIFITTAEEIDFNQPMTLIINNCSIDVKVVHHNIMKCRKKFHSGYGVKIDDHQAQSTLSNLIIN